MVLQQKNEALFCNAGIAFLAAGWFSCSSTHLKKRALSRIALA
jgi:hypothetical protein